MLLEELGQRQRYLLIWVQQGYHKYKEMHLKVGGSKINLIRKYFYAIVLLWKKIHGSLKPNILFTIHMCCSLPVQTGKPVFKEASIGYAPKVLLPLRSYQQLLTACFEVFLTQVFFIYSHFYKVNVLFPFSPNQFPVTLANSFGKEPGAAE